jgi:hypothetical protein
MLAKSHDANAQAGRLSLAGGLLALQGVGLIAGKVGLSLTAFSAAGRCRREAAQSLCRYDRPQSTYR